MKRFLAIILSLLMLCLVLVACDGNDESSSSDSGGDEVIADTSGLSYHEVDGAYAVSIGTQVNATKIIIPSVYNGKSVSRIYASGFKDAKSLKSVVIPSSVRIIDESAFYGCTSLESVTIIVDEIDMRLTTIGASAFYGCESLASINIPSSLTSLGTDAFDGCTALDFNEHEGGYYIGDSSNPYLIFVKPSDHDQSAFDISLHDGTKFIHSRAFAGNEYLKSIDLPGGIKSFGKNAFDGCVRLSRVNYLGNIENWCSATFSNKSANPLNKGLDLSIDGSLATSIGVPNNISKINDFAFIGCRSIKNVVLPDGLTEIGQRAFECCSSLESVSFADNLRVVGEDAFLGCTSMNKVDYVGEIDTWLDISFANEKANPLSAGASLCLSGEPLVELVIPSTVGEVGDFAFVNCSSIEKIVIPVAVTKISANAFSGVKIKELTCAPSVIELLPVDELTHLTIIGEGEGEVLPTSSLKKLTHLTISGGVSTISRNAFSGNELLKEVIIGNCVTEIEERAFYQCTSLESVTLSSNIKEIPSFAFYSCDSLKSVVLPSSMAVISSNAFHGCDLLESINFPNGLTEIDFASFSDCPNLKSIFIPLSVTRINEYAFSSAGLERVYCAVSKMPSTWSDSWLGFGREIEVIWGYTGE